MNSSNSSEHILDNLPYEMAVAVKSVECATVPFLLGAVIVMYRGIEINHPGNFFQHIL
jgi:hypothetical protein